MIWIWYDAKILLSKLYAFTTCVFDCKFAYPRKNNMLIKTDNFFIFVPKIEYLKAVFGDFFHNFMQFCSHSTHICEDIY